MRESERASAAAPPFGLGFAEDADAGRPHALLSGLAAAAAGGRRWLQAGLSGTPAASPAAILALPVGATSLAPKPAAVTGVELGQGAGRGRGCVLPSGAGLPKAQAPRAKPTLATLIAQLSQALEGQRTFEARLGRLEAPPPTRPQTASLGVSSALVNGGGVVPVCGPQVLQSQPSMLVGHPDLFNTYGRGSSILEVVRYVRLWAVWLAPPKRAVAGDIVPPPPPPTRSQAQEVLTGPGAPGKNVNMYVLGLFS